MKRKETLEKKEAKRILNVIQNNPKLSELDYAQTVECAKTIAEELSKFQFFFYEQVVGELNKPWVKEINQIIEQKLNES